MFAIISVIATLITIALLADIAIAIIKFVASIVRAIVAWIASVINTLAWYGLIALATSVITIALMNMIG